MESHRKVLTGKLKRSRAHSQRPALMATYWRIPIIRHSGICKNYTGRKTSAETEEGADCRGGCSPRECRRLMVHLAYGDGYRTVCVVQLRELRTKKSEFYCVWTQMSAGRGGPQQEEGRPVSSGQRWGQLRLEWWQPSWHNEFGSKTVWEQGQEICTPSTVSLSLWDWWATNVCYPQLWLLTYNSPWYTFSWWQHQEHSLVLWHPGPGAIRLPWWTPESAKCLQRERMVLLSFLLPYTLHTT